MQNNEYFCYRGEDCLDAFAKRMNKNLSKFAYFHGWIIIAMTDDDKKEPYAMKVCYLCSMQFKKGYNKF